MPSILYGVGVGPGDPELMTQKAIRIIRESEVIGIPAKDKESCTAYKIAVQAVPELEDKEILPVFIPMTKDKEKRQAAYEAGCEKIKTILDSGRNIAFLNLGDPTIYATYMVIHNKMTERGYTAQLINGVPSFCAVAAELGIALGAGKENIHILPGCYDISDMEKYSGTKVLMKSGEQMEQVRNKLMDMEKQDKIKAYAVTDCGMKSQKIYRNLEELSTETGYFTTIIVKDKKSRKRQ
jgi:precorrin-2 C(20)-methyltransferase